MATSKEDVAKWLDERGWEYALIEESEQTRFVFSLECAGGLTLSVEISLSEEGQFLQFRAAELVSGKDLESSPYRRRILAAAAEESYRRRLAKVGYDPGDGEIDCCVDLPLEDCPLTRRQFEYALHVLIVVARLVHRRVATIQETGRDPGPLEVDDLAKPE
jgi:hypothetical protein